MVRKRKKKEKEKAQAETAKPAAPDAEARTAPPAQGERPFFGRIKDAWRDTVGAYATDEGETRNLVKRLVEFGTLSAEEARQLLSEATERVEKNRRELDNQVEESIKRAASRLTVPSPEEIKELNRRVAEAESRIAALEKKKRARAGR
jgi:polyhydroxyalkanoate synthesis regulator phasin